jgi:hypothetical protein
MEFLLRRTSDWRKTVAEQEALEGRTIEINTLDELLEFIDGATDSDGDPCQRIVLERRWKDDRWVIEIYDGYRE